MDTFLTPFEAKLRAFAEEFHQESWDDQRNIELKRDHSFRVLAEARRILQALRLSEEENRITALAALFHDIGRFPQYSDFKTFRDSISVNHARLGARVLKRGNILSGVDRSQIGIVLAAILIHNRRRIPPVLTGSLRTICGVVRDADKLDIMPLLLSHFVPGAAKNAVVTWNLKADPDGYSPDIFNNVIQGRLASNDDMVYENDFKLMLLSWVYDFNFPVSYRAFLDRGYLERIMTLLPNHRPFQDLADRLFKYLHQHCA